MSKVRRSFSRELKSKIALEAIIGHSSVNEIAREYKVHPNQVGLWKKQLIENIPKLFDNPRGPKTESNSELIDQLYRQIGKLQVEIEWLKKKYETFS
jgi:transposase